MRVYSSGRVGSNIMQLAFHALAIPEMEPAVKGLIAVYQFREDRIRKRNSPPTKIALLKMQSIGEEI